MRVLRVLIATCLAVAAYAQQTDAEKLIEAGHWKQARAMVEARLHQAPDDALATFLLSQIRNAFGDYATPLPLAEKAVALDGRVAKYHRQLAEVLGVEAQHAGAVKLVFLAYRFRGEIDTAISIDPHDVQAQRDLLEYYLVAPGIAGGDMRNAEATAQQIGRIDLAEGLLAKARIAVARKQAAETEAMLRQAVQSQPPSYRARVELAKFYTGTGHSDPTAAENLAKELLKLDRSRVEPYAILAPVYAEKADWNALDTILTDANHSDPDDLAPYYRAAVTLLDTGRDPARAERYLHVYLEREPEGNEPSLSDARRSLAQAQLRRPE